MCIRVLVADRWRPVGGTPLMATSCMTNAGNLQLAGQGESFQQVKVVHLHWLHSLLPHTLGLLLITEAALLHIAA